MVLIPCYKEEKHIGEVVRQIASLNIPNIYVINDGSPDNTAIVAEQAGANVISHSVNQGKGAALNTGFQFALDNHFDAVITMDGDGQHLPKEINDFIVEFAKSDSGLIVGSRMKNTKRMPLIRKITNKFMSSLISSCLGQRVTDTQSGFRLYSSSVIPICLKCLSGGFSAESEHLLQISLHGFKISEIPITTIYGDEKSKIRPIRDTIRFIKMMNHFREEKRKFEKGQSV